MFQQWGSAFIKGNSVFYIGLSYCLYKYNERLYVLYKKRHFVFLPVVCCQSQERNSEQKSGAI